MLNNPNRYLSFAFLNLLVLFFTACSSVTGYREKPKLSLVDISAEEVGLLEQVFLIKVRVSNPNEADLPLNGLVMKIKLNQQSFATAMSGENLSIPRYSDKVITLRAYTSSLDWLRNFREIVSSEKDMVKYQIDGSINSDSIFGLVDFNSEGELSLSKLFDVKNKPKTKEL